MIALVVAIHLPPGPPVDVPMVGYVAMSDDAGRGLLNVRAGFSRIHEAHPSIQAVAASCCVVIGDGLLRVQTAARLAVVTDDTVMPLPKGTPCLAAFEVPTDEVVALDAATGVRWQGAVRGVKSGWRRFATPEVSSEAVHDLVRFGSFGFSASDALLVAVRHD